MPRRDGPAPIQERGDAEVRIIVCVKQVPGTNKVEVDPETGVLKRDGVAAKLNPYDLFALETAFSLAADTGATVSTITMGPPQAKAALEETIWMGADDAVLLSDRKFAGADVAATSYALAGGIRQMGEYSLIICGKQTTDGDTAQVGPEMAERLGMEHVANVIEVLALDEKSITVRVDLDSMVQTLKMELPCLITVDKDVNTPRLPSYLRKKSTAEEERIRVLSAADLAGVDEKKLGLKGSPTQVERIFPPEKSSSREMLQGTDPELAAQLYGILRGRKFV